MQAFLLLLALLLIGLKLAGVILVSWWVATAPLWGPIMIDLAAVICIALYSWSVSAERANRETTR